jgi:tetratricopeptide (TPR) repeat protein
MPSECASVVRRAHHERISSAGRVLLLWLALPVLAAAQQAPAPPDLPAPYHGTPIDKALKAREWPRAEELLLEAIERQPGSPGLLSVLGSVFLIEKKPLNAAIAIKKAEALAPIDDRTRFTLVLAYIAMNHGDWARPELEKLVASDSANPAYDYWLGRLDYDSGLYASAVKRFQKVIEAEPGAVRAYDNLGLCYEALNQPEDALPPYRKAVELNRTAPAKSAWPPLNLGILLRNRGELKEAESLLREAVRYEDHLAQPYYQLGVLFEQLNRPDDAVTELTRATERDANYAESYYALARIYRKLGRKQEADAALATFQRLHDAKRTTPGQ